MMRVSFFIVGMGIRASRILMLIIFYCLAGCDGINTSRNPVATLLPPEDNRFVKTTLVRGLKEPMELAVTPDNNIFWVERKGQLYYFDASLKKADEVEIPFKVFTGINDGLLGIALDPEFSANSFVYLFYSPRGEVSKQHVSRFVFDEETLTLENEIILLEIPTQRESCCHSGGGLAFGPEGNLYIGVGDNSSPRTEPAYAPVDERPGHEAYDAQRTSANSNDLRGKILRIHPEDDGTYSIPDGNLFQKGTPKTRPEIYVMGARNPFRFSVDRQTGYLYFGDVGPDATKADWYGPEAYDEINLVKKAGNYGWPYFVGANKSYPKYDFASKTAGDTSNPEAPVNTSPNNNGITILPPVQKPMIWYSFEASKEFSVLGKGGRSAMAGPVYRYDPENPDPNKFPAYYDNNLFVFDWMRNWLKAVRLKDDGSYSSMEDFMAGNSFSSPMDMTFGTDGTMYLLEYGKGWYSDNADAQLVRITYVSGNRPPEVKLAASAVDGAIPLEVSFSSDGSGDLDGDTLQYEWRLVNTEEVISREPDTKFVFTQPGVSIVKLSITDTENNTSESVVKIIAGNTKPEIAIEMADNATFYWPDRKVRYQVRVTDAEDGAWPRGEINPSDIRVFLEYSTNADNLSPMITAQKRLEAGEDGLLNHPGKILIEQSDCQACHAPRKESIGPTYEAIARRYRNRGMAAMDSLVSKIINGGGGVWNREFVMVGHPDMSRKTAAEIVKYIYTFADEKSDPQPLGPSGILRLSKPANSGDGGKFYLTASYKDEGGPNIPALETSTYLTLIPARLQAEKYSGYGGQIRTVGDIEEGDKRYINLLRSGRIFFEDIDLTNIGSVLLRYSAREIMGTSLEIRIDSINGPVVGAVSVEPTGKTIQWRSQKIGIKETKGKHSIFLVGKNVNPAYKDQKALILISMDWIQFYPLSDRKVVSN